MGRDHGERWERSASVGDHHGAGSHQSGSYRHQDRSREYADRESTSLEERQPWNAAMDNMSRALCRPTQSSFSRDIERALCQANLQSLRSTPIMERKTRWNM